MVLTTCRIWRFGVERVHCTKSEAGRWALARDASLSAIDGALRRRAGNQAVIRGDEISRLIQVVVTDLAARETKDEAWMP
jgi:hypothetical protein